MTNLDALLAGIVQEPREETRWLVLADWLEEYDDPRRAELLRLHRRLLATCCEPWKHAERAEWQARMTDLLIAGVRPCVPQETLMLPGGVPMTFSFIPPGAFLMGSEKGEENEKPIRRVELLSGFFLGIHPVTRAQWAAVTGAPPRAIEYYYPENDNPVENLPAESAGEFCTKLSDLFGRCLELPTEVEWEYACRAGTTTEYYFGETINTDIVNHCPDDRYGPPVGLYRRTATPPGMFPPNPWGLCDLHGNL